MNNKLKYVIMFAVIINLMIQLISYSTPNQEAFYCPTKPYQVSNPLTRGVQGVLGLNFLASKFAESTIKNELSKAAKGKFEVNIEPYSAMDLVAGKLKKFELKAQNINFNDIYISSFEAGSLCDFIHIDYNKNPIEFISPVFVGFKGKITQDDINNIISSPTYSEKLKNVKIKLYGNDIDLVDFLNPKVEINNNKIILTSDIHFSAMPEFMKVPIRVETGLKLSDNKLKLASVNISSSSPLGGGVKLISDFIRVMNPTIFDISTLEQNGMKFNLKNFNIKDNSVKVEGNVWIPGTN